MVICLPVFVVVMTWRFAGAVVVDENVVVEVTTVVCGLGVTVFTGVI